MMLTPSTDTSLLPNISSFLVFFLTSSTRLSNASGMGLAMVCDVEPLNTIAAPEMPGAPLEQTLE